MIYTETTLKELNPLYEHYHTLTKGDVDNTNYWIGFITGTRNIESPQVGDIIQYTDSFGNYYENAHIEEVDKDSIYICERASVPFVGKLENGELYTSASGGTWTNIPNKLSFVGKRKKTFKDWGRLGPNGNGAIEFQVEVNVWEYAEKALEYTTKTHDKYELYVRDDVTSNQYKFIIKKDGMNHTAFHTEKEYLAWLKTFNGVETDNQYYDSHKTIWTFKQITKRLPMSDYLLIEGIKDTELNNGSIQECKRVISGKEITTYLPFEKVTVEGVRYMNAHKQLS